MSEVKQGDTVHIHYTGRLVDGTEFDSSSGRDPLSFEVGAGQIIPGLEKGIVGMSVGEKQTITVPSDEAYGPHRPEGVQEVPKSALPADMDPQVGGMLQAVGGDGQRINLVVTDVGAESITVDANHPLAGKDLIFDIEVMAVA